MPCGHGLRKNKLPRGLNSLAKLGEVILPLLTVSPFWVVLMFAFPRKNRFCTTFCFICIVLVGILMHQTFDDFSTKNVVKITGTSEHFALFGWKRFHMLLHRSRARKVKVTPPKKFFHLKKSIFAPKILRWSPLEKNKNNLESQPRPVTCGGPFWECNYFCLKVIIIVCLVRCLGLGSPTSFVPKFAMQTCHHKKTRSISKATF